MLGLSGALLASDPVQQAWQAPAAPGNLSVATPVQRVTRTVPGTQEIRGLLSGAIVVFRLEKFLTTPATRQVFVLAATYGHDQAPAHASHALARIAKLSLGALSSSPPKPVTGLVAQGAIVRVRGGRAMAQGVAVALDALLAPIRLSVLQLKAQERYAEAIF